MNADSEDSKYKELIEVELLLNFGTNQNLNVRHLIIRENSYLPAMRARKASF